MDAVNPSLLQTKSVKRQQHYTLTLLDQLFKHIPPQMTIGLLYDIGCQLERSCQKWNLLDSNTLSHIYFTVVIIYHPRKCEGFGFSLKQLIPSLHVSGFHQCLFVLNAQIRHLDTKSIQGYGHWLHWRWLHRQTKKNTTLDGLLDLDVNEDILRQSKNKVAEVITTILALEKTLDTHKTSVRELEMQLYVDILRHCKATLGPQGQADLMTMKNNIYLTICLNAHAVKTRIRDHLHQRKFELERLERSYRATVNDTLLLFCLNFLACLMYC
ncbi:uncharacterized protein EDB93DRAFT_1242269 [Suillus bovinus]|uniref:uncharacterized protein n=1 Tax=Suillus bovinus TaxID=48563 RepID=UPI001B85DDB4|nr:uncharacterized protein EDB93DRAFT_1242269 [Suillus bovinus]KAG2137449.1 hypothetical protein EDB93DRAFT_1242269 [Suillus bovinus]